MGINVFDILNKVYGPKGIPFPSHADTEPHGLIGSGFKLTNKDTAKRDHVGTAIKQFDSEDLGTYTFLPAVLDGLNLPNPVVIISGEKEIVETNIVNVGTVFERVFIKPYSISIIATLVGKDGEWPETELRNVVDVWKKDDVLTLRCALTNVFLKSENNFVVTNIQLLDAQGAENVEVVQIDGRSNIDFELTIVK
jgi:hypothetical protein